MIWGIVSLNAILMTLHRRAGQGPHSCVLLEGFDSSPVVFFPWTLRLIQAVMPLEASALGLQESM